MIMTTLSSEGRLRGLCANMLRRSRSYMLYFGVLCFVIYPLQYMLHVFDPDFPQRVMDHSKGLGSLGLFTKAAPHMTDGTAVMVFLAVMAMTMVIGLSQFSYLHSKKAVDVYHALPVRRSTLLLAGVLSAFITVMLPLAANYLIVLAVGLVVKAANPLFPLIALPLLADLFCWAVLVFAVLCVIAFVSVQMGSVFDSFIFSCELLVVLPALIYLTLLMFEQYLRGFSIGAYDVNWLLYTSPLTAKIQHYSAGGDEGFFSPDYLTALAVMALWLVLAAGLLWLTARLYHRRPSELAEASSSRTVLARVGVLAGVYLAGNVCGVLFADMTDGLFDRRWAYVFWTVLFSALIYILAQMVLLRGFRGMKKALLPGVLTVVTVGIFAALLAGGGLGYETRIPDLEKVESVTVNYRGRYVSISLLDAESRREYESEDLPGIVQNSYGSVSSLQLTGAEGVDAVRRLHYVASNRDMDREESGNRRWTTYLSIRYDLTDGRTLRRYYNYNELSAVEPELLLLEDAEEFKQKTHPVFTQKASDYAAFRIGDAYGCRETVLDDQPTMQRLMDALAADMLAEKVSSLDNTTELAPCTIWFEDAAPMKFRLLEEDTYTGGFVMVRPSYTNTLQVLREAGLDEYAETQRSDIASLKVVHDSWWGGSGESPVMMLDGYHATTRYDFARQMELNYGSVAPEEGLTVTVTDPAQIRAITEASFSMGCPELDPFTVLFYLEDGSYGGVAQVDLADLPQEVTDRFADWVVEDYNRNAQRLGYGYAYTVAKDETEAVIGGADGPTSIAVVR